MLGEQGQAELRARRDEGDGPSAEVLSYHGPAAHGVQVRRPWHVYVALVLCWAPPAAIVVMVCMEIVARLRGKTLIGGNGLLMAAVASPAAVMWVILSYRAVILASLRATRTLLMLYFVLTPLPALLMIPVLQATLSMRRLHGRELAFLAINLTLWSVIWSLVAWARRLAGGSSNDRQVA